MKAFLITLSLLLSVAYAGDRNSAYNAICKPMTFETERAACMAKLKKYHYFDDRGLAFCKSLRFDDDRVSCMEIIGDKVYETYEMDHCLNKTFDQEKVDCLNENGSPSIPDRQCVQREEAIFQLDAGIKEMRAGNLKSADQRLSYLLNRFMDCRHR